MRNFTHTLITSRFSMKLVKCRPWSGTKNIPLSIESRWQNATSVRRNEATGIIMVACALLNRPGAAIVANLDRG